MKDSRQDELGAPKVVERNTFQAELDTLRVREKAHTREGDAIAAARRRLPMVEVDGATPLIGAQGAVTLLDAFEGRRMLIAYYWTTGRGNELMAPSYGLLALTVYGRQEFWEDSPQRWGSQGGQFQLKGRPTTQWPRLQAGFSDDLGTDGR